MNREKMIQRLKAEKEWDFIIVGGGATGLGTALEAASRGLKTLLVEQFDFGQGTSSRSTKLIHGGVRYLQQGNISLVLEALKERGILRKNAPHLVYDLPFIVPVYDWWEGPFYGIGLKFYDMLAGKEAFGPSKRLTREETIHCIPTIEQEGLRGGVIYHDGQFDDARLLINLAQTAEEQGACVLNYFKADQLIKENDLIKGLEISDTENGEKYHVYAKAIINATGVFSDSIRKMDEPDCKPVISGSQGIHLVLNARFLRSETGIMVPHTDDGRVIFAIPWHNRLLVGTTDTAIDSFLIEPVALEEEITFLLKHISRYLDKAPKRKDVLSVFAGLRPLVSNVESESTAAISREHSILISRSGLVSIAGGKWTTYRKMAEDTVDQAAIVAQVKPKISKTKQLAIHGAQARNTQNHLSKTYGSDDSKIETLLKENSEYSKKIHPDFPFLIGEIIWAAREEMARKIEDFLSRRTRWLLLDAKVAMEVAPLIAERMASVLQKDAAWIEAEIESFRQLAKNYDLNGN
ncbi:MAG TPA: FAD-dependent oxidoreductase [Bacteroidales bacterium]|nr:FAD-dependent oxidoreductase [Bacteroidales bacterium]